MLIFFLFTIVIIFVVVVAYLLLEGNDNKVDFYEELKREDKEEIDNILEEEKNKSDKFIIVDNVD